MLVESLLIPTVLIILLLAIVVSNFPCGTLSPPRDFVG